MSNANQETIADIVAALRADEAKGVTYGSK